MDSHTTSKPPSRMVDDAPSVTTSALGYEQPIDSLVGNWWVLHTRSRNEKVVAERLVKQGVQVFLPLVHRSRVYDGRVRRVDIPLFPGYVFLCGQQKDRELALKTNRVAQILDVPDQQQLQFDLRQIQQIVQSDEPVDLFPRLKDGARCRVISGSLAGLEGIVIRRQGPWRVFVSVHFVGQSAELEVDSTMVEVID